MSITNLPEDESAVPEPQAEAQAIEEPSDGQRVPLDRFRAVTDENKNLRERLDALEVEKHDREQADLTEVERERQARELAEEQLATAQARAETLERSQWVKDAAMNAGFADPEDAALLVKISELQGAEDAAQAVKDLAERKPHLIRKTDDGPRPMGSPLNAPPVDSNDPKAGLGADLLRHLTGR